MKIFISGIDTDAGKSYATGFLARHLADKGKDVITMKFIQTGNHEFSEDIDVHRKLMGCGLLPDDLDHTTAPVIFSYPCSPQLAARIDNRDIDLSVIDAAADRLDSNHDVVLIEGAGGLMVPLTDDFLTIDYPLTRHLPVALVTNGRLGSISHTLLALDALKRRDMELAYLLYNTHFDADKVIVDDTRAFLRRYLDRNFKTAEWLDIPSL
ncbi:MAG: ATP-dependent dethiobiotin synthetase BioD [Bacteroidales bacterium]|nr:ATP-dependent dethiobiotin synthetase BioD [Bacteroidales bacterium]